MQQHNQISENTSLSEVHKLVLVMRFVAARIEGNEDNLNRPYEDPIYGALHLAQLLRAGIAAIPVMKQHDANAHLFAAAPALLAAAKVTSAWLTLHGPVDETWTATGGDALRAAIEKALPS